MFGCYTGWLKKFVRILCTQNPFYGTKQKNLIYRSNKKKEKFHLNVNQKAKEV